MCFPDKIVSLNTFTSWHQWSVTRSCNRGAWHHRLASSSGKYNSNWLFWQNILLMLTNSLLLHIIKVFETWQIHPNFPLHIYKMTPVQVTITRNTYSQSWYCWSKTNCITDVSLFPLRVRFENVDVGIFFWWWIFTSPAGIFTSVNNCYLNSLVPFQPLKYQCSQLEPHFLLFFFLNIPRNCISSFLWHGRRRLVTHSHCLCQWLVLFLIFTSQLSYLSFS